MNNDAAIIRREFRRSKEARYIHRLHGVLLVLLGSSAAEAGKLLGVPQRTIAHWVIEFKRHGLDGLVEAKNTGRPASLNPRQQKTLFLALKKSPTDAGLSGTRWTGARVAEFLRERYGINLTMRHCRRLLRAYEQKL
ncbi:MAG: helix-turn-helix domain-containing protein [Verrucomicrobiota bacterium]